MPSLHKLLEGPAEQVAPLLLGAHIKREINGQSVVCRVVEVEAYDQTDPASHTYRGLTPRTKTMFGRAGHLYVYFTYGMHFCCNVVTGPVGHGAAVLIRAVEPLEGADIVRVHRLGIAEKQLTNGPGKLCRALAIDKRFDGHDLQSGPIQLLMQPALATSDITQTTRIGISQAKDVPWRFYISGNPYVSKPL